MSSLFNISCKNTNNSCNFIEPIDSFNIYPSSNGISKITGRPITSDEVNAVFNSYNSVCNSKGGIIAGCCNSDSSIAPNDVRTKVAYNELRSTYPYARLTTSSNGSELLQLATAPVYESGWTPISPYIMCKLSMPGNLVITPDTYNPKILNITGLQGDCSKQRCSSDSLSFDMLMSGIRQDTSYTYYDDSKVVDDIKNGNLDGVKSYIYKYNYVDQPLSGDDLQNRMVHIAALYGNLDIMNLLIAVNADVNSKNLDGDTPLHIAARANNQDIVNTLISQGSSITMRNVAGRTPIFSAIESGDLAMILILYNSGAGLLDVDADGNNMCHYTILKASSNKLELIRFFIAHGVSVDQRNNDGASVLDLLDTAISQTMSSDVKSEQLSKADYLNLKNNIMSARVSSHGNGSIANNVEETFSNINGQVSVSAPAILSNNLEDLMSIQTLIRTQAYKELYSGSSETVFRGSSSIPQSVPVILDSKICVPKYGTASSDIVGNEDSTTCVQMGGEMVGIRDPGTSATISYYSPLDQDIAKINDRDLYRPKYDVLVNSTSLPTPKLEVPTKVDIPTELAPISPKVTDPPSMLSGYSNLSTFIVILLIVLCVMFGIYLYKTK